MAVKKDGHVYVQAGGGIVADSIPENEYMESYNKALAVMNAVKKCKGGAVIMILLIDNYDSFSYNLVQMAGSINPDIKVIRNDAMTVEEIRALAPSHIILSPGPGYPKDAGVCEEVVRHLQGKIPILGVCLGHQGICEVYGCTILMQNS